MSTMLFAAPAASPLASFRRAVSAPVPWYASHAARRVTERILERWHREGNGPIFISLTSKAVRYPVGTVDAFVAGAVR